MNKNYSIEKVIKDYAILGSIWKVGQKHNISGQKVHYILNKNGINTSKKKEFTNQQIKEIKNIYKTMVRGDGKLDAFCQKHEKDKANVCRFAKKLGLTNKHRKKVSPVLSKKISRSIKAYIKDKGHPQGMKGKTHTDKTKVVLSNKSKEMWNDPHSYVNTQEYRQIVSDRMSLRQSNGAYKNPYSRCHQGKYDINGKLIFFRSSWEANYALYLDFLIKQKEIIEWEFEPDTFWFEIKRGVRSYKPDFKVQLPDGSIQYHEVKGWMDSKSKTKLKRMAKYYPEINIILIDAPVYKDIKNKLGKMLKFY